MRPQRFKKYGLIVLVVLPVMMGLTRVSNPLRYGLTKHYYENTEWTGTPIMRARDTSFKIEEPKIAYPLVGTHYSIQWTGVLFIPMSGVYQFTTISDDGSELFLDHHVVVENGGFHGPREQTASVSLEKGFHPIEIRYMQGEGEEVFEAYWSQPGRKREALSHAPLFQELPTKPAFFAGQVLGLLFTICQYLFVFFFVIVTGIVLSFRHEFPRFLSNSLMSLLIFLAVFAGHFFGDQLISLGDSRWSVHTTVSLIKEGNTNLDEYTDLIERHEYYAIESIDNHLYTVFPVGAAFIAIPYVFIIDKFFKNSLSIDLKTFISTRIPGGIETGVASIIVALSSVCIYLISALFFDDVKYSLLIVFIFAFCTSVWSVASRALMQHGPSLFLLALSLYLLLLAKYKPRYTIRIIPFVSLPLAFSYVVRPTNSISIVIISIFIFIRYRKSFFWYCLLSALVVIPFILFNLQVYHAVLSPYYLPQRIGSNSHFFEALAGNLFSPSRGLLLFSPIFVCSFYGIFLKIKNKHIDLLDYSILGIIFFHWLCISSFPFWWGGYSYGPRFFSDMIPYFIYFMIPAFLKLSTLQGIMKAGMGAALFCAVAVSFLIQYRGVTNIDVHLWNAFPVSVNEEPSRLWDWRDIQFLRGIQ